MAVNMARIQDGYVVNMESWSESQEESETLKPVGDKPVMIGDRFTNGRYYRGATEILAPVEEENLNLLAAVAEAAELLYEADLASISVLEEET